VYSQALLHALVAAGPPFFLEAMSAMPETAAKIRNVAIIAHVDHGKTTLVDKLIAQTGVLRENQEVPECLLDSNDLERERGITILSKNISLRYEGVKINIIDTPGHADFGGEVERVLQMADGCLVLVDAFEGPMPQTRFVLKKALAANLRPVIVVNKLDRAPDRGHRAVDEIFDLMGELGANDTQLDFPVLFASGRSGWARYEVEDDNDNLVPLLDTIIKHVPAPTSDCEGSACIQVTTLDWSSYTGRIGIGRLDRGILRTGDNVFVHRAEGSPRRGTIRRLLTFEGMDRAPADEVRAGDLCAVEGLEDLTIGDTITHEETDEPLPRIKIDPPTLSMVFQVNDGPFAGRDGRYVTSRQLRERLYRETLGNVALRVEDTHRPEALKVSGRGILHLGILIEEMRREGFEFCVGKPEVICREIDGKRHEPVEDVHVEVPEKLAGRVIEVLGQRKGEMIKMDSHGDFARIQYRCPSRGLIGLRTIIMNQTQGEAIFVHTLAGYEPFKGEITTRATGVMVASEMGDAVHYALSNLKDRGSFFIPPGEHVYEGMVVGEHSKDNDIMVNVSKGKKLTNVRASGSDKKLFLPPHRDMGVEAALEYVAEDEYVEITPNHVRLRKILLRDGDRRRARRAGA